MTTTAQLIGNLQAEIAELQQQLDNQGGMLELHRMRVEELERENEALRSIARSVASEQLHTLPYHRECKCSRCELIREASAAMKGQ